MSKYYFELPNIFYHADEKSQNLPPHPIPNKYRTSGIRPAVFPIYFYQAKEKKR